MRTVKLGKTLTLPLSIATALSLILAQFLSWQGFFVNLATTFIGILITVFYVDLVLDKHEAQQWSKVRTLVHGRVERFANLSISYFRDAYGFGPDIINDAVFDSDDPTPRRGEIARIAEQVLAPATEMKLDEMGPADWKKLTGRLSSVVEMADQLVGLFGNKLEPETLSLIFEIQDRADSILSKYSILPEFFGTPDDQLPTPTKGSAVAHKRFFYKATAEDARRLLSKAGELLRRL
jgi:hypothetical protein